jgi:polyisoprenoid-binding protein YceI
MKRFILLTFLILIYASVFGQNTYFSRTGHIYFLSHTDAIDIDANNHQGASFLDINSGKLQFAILIKSFEFSLATAKEHFNESYMDSDKYPKAEFKGQIQNVDSLDFSKCGVYHVKVNGDINIRNIKKHIQVNAELTVKKQGITANTDFYLTVSDFNIKVPKVVAHRISKDVLVKVKIDYLPYQR